jgi:acyl dehydratase
MSDQITYDQVEVGAEIAEVSYPATRLSLVMYCGASGDFNVIHWNERIAKSVGLPDVIAHGMFTMAQAGRFVTDWAGPKATVVEFGVRFSAPVVVPDDDIGPLSTSPAKSRRSSTTTGSRWRSPPVRRTPRYCLGPAP